MSFSEKSCKEFTDELSTKAPVPGGGGASALVGSVGVALGSMVANLTAGKKKYAEFEDDIQRILAESETLKDHVLGLADEDAKVFEPLSRAYGIPKDDPTRDAVMEDALKKASSVPLEIMKDCCRAIDMHAELSEKGSMLAISDVGVGAVCCKAALMGASLNVFINTKSMKDRVFAGKLNAEADAMLEKYCPLADEIFERINAKLR